MAGYIGTKAVSLSTTAADVNGDANVDGTITADGLTVEDGSSSKITIESTNPSGETGTLEFYRTNASHAVAQIVDEREGDLNGGKLNIKTFDTSGSMKLRMDIDQGGDISFYEDTGTTPKFFWDASAESLGIGTSSPDALLHLSSPASSIRFTDTSPATDVYSDIGIDDAGTMYFQADRANTASGTAMIFKLDNSEAMRIDSSGNLLVGKTSSDAGATAGLEYHETFGVLYVTDSGGESAVFNRLSSDGDIVRFRKDGSTVGSIVVDGSRLSFVSDNGSTGGGLKMTSAYIAPTNRAGGTIDNVLDCGAAAARFDNIRATNGSIVTSDRNEKQQIASLTTAEITAAKAISQLFKTYKWNSAVAEKGDAARTHTGVIAQDVETALTNAGLDAGDYAFFISDTWWETQTDVPAVAAVAEVLDDDGNVVTEAVEAQDAYTRTDTYEVQAEAPAGATERTRLGIRYPELLSFVGAATQVQLALQEQRLADIETRLTALEAV